MVAKQHYYFYLLKRRKLLVKRELVGSEEYIFLCSTGNL